MSALHQHIQKQQDKAVTLCGVIEAIAILDNEDMGRGSAVTSLIQVAGQLIDEITNGLDNVHLPEGGAQ